MCKFWFFWWFDVAQCTDYDFDHGTECLHLAQRYGNARVSLIDGPDNLWKVSQCKNSLMLVCFQLVSKASHIRVSISSVMLQSKQFWIFVNHLNKYQCFYSMRISKQVFHLFIGLKLMIRNFVHVVAKKHIGVNDTVRTYLFEISLLWMLIAKSWA